MEGTNINLSTRSLAALALLWGVLVVAGFGILGREAYQAAPHVAIHASFPSGSALALDPKRLTLILFVHPQCPCTEATFADLDQLRTEVRDQLAVTIVFTIPPGEPADWAKGRLWSEAGEMPGVRVLRDMGGTETRHFGVTTSGHALLYRPDGHLLFSGGITASRGHAGDSPGELAIIHLTKEPAYSDTVEKPVFGCTLL